ncbi:MAG: acyl-ACP--UDP-N-acetylglucosamine O-acyltransferase [Tildeniella nuda ZEHNDER 1965/U140]|nr:acyl-ACP--UDP-N-acetylglucosamine O-acyltransferase [Tildeniella nuda ZEHNDER 1965/U140]
MITSLHPTATIHPDAELHPTVQVGAHAVIGAKVKVGPETVIGPNVVLDGWTEIGARNQIFPGAAIGVEPQDPTSTGVNSLVKIGDDNQIREYVTISRSNQADEVTAIGDRNLLMAYIHIAQGCVIENHVVIANAVILGEHVHVESRAFISGVGEIHPFVHVGRLVMVAFMHQITRDIPPYMLVEGQPARVRSLNRVGLKRAGLAAEQEGQVIQTLRTAFRLLYRSGFSLDESLEKLDTLPDNEHLLHLRQFLRRSQVEGRRGLTPGKGLGGHESNLVSNVVDE